jgi:hypothetical protein
MPFAGIAGSPYGIVKVGVLSLMTLLSGSPVGVLAGQSGSASVPPDMVWDWLNKQLWVCTGTGGTPPATTWTQLQEVGVGSFTSFTAQSVTTTGPISDGGALTVSGLSTLNGAVTLNQPVTVNANLTMSAAGTLTANGTFIANGGGTLAGTFAGNPTLSGAITFTNSLYLPNNVAVWSRPAGSQTYTTLLYVNTGGDTHLDNVGGGNVGLMNQADSAWLLRSDNAGNVYATTSLNAPTATINGQMNITGIGNFQNNINVGGQGINFTNYYGGHHIAFGWDGSYIQSWVDNTYEGAMASTGWVQGNYYSAGTADGRYLYKTGDTCSGSLTVNGALNTGGNVNVGNVLQVNGSGNIAGGATIPTLIQGSDNNWVRSESGGNRNDQFGPNFYWAWNLGSGNLAWSSPGTGSWWFVLQNSGGLVVWAAAAKSGGGSWAVASDDRLKTVTGRYTKGLEAVLQLDPIEFEYTGTFAKRSNTVGQRFIGLSADDTAEPFPEMVYSADIDMGPEEEPLRDMKHIDGNALTYAMVNAIKTLANRVAELEAAQAPLGRKV